jgi:hypothetical protein
MSPPATPETERRAWPRRRRRFRVFLGQVLDGGQTPCRACVVDRSPGGLRLSIAPDVETGKILKIRSVAAPARMGWVAVEVMNRQVKGNTVELGCKFLESPSLLTLLLFG